MSIQELSPSVGYRSLKIWDDIGEVEVPVAVLYPAEAPAQMLRFGPYSIDVAPEADGVGRDLPLVVISHGSRGLPWTHRGLAAGLARRGFVVALPEHPGDNARDTSLCTPDDVPVYQNLVQRPRHLRCAIAVARAAESLGPLLSQRVGVVGHSLGAYTALALAGGQGSTFPDEVPLARRLQPDADTLSKLMVLPDASEPSVGAAVLLAPTLHWFAGPGALDGVDVPVLARLGEHDRMCAPSYVNRLLAPLEARGRLDSQVVDGAGHFSFLSPFPVGMGGPYFPPAQDPPGFDRAAYQADLLNEIATFLGENLCGLTLYLNSPLDAVASGAKVREICGSRKFRGCTRTHCT